MKLHATKKWLLAVATGMITLQAATCAANLTALSTTVTAGGVIFIIARILQE